MNFNLSTFGKKFTRNSGILQLMADLGEAAGREGVLMLGGGNPSHIPAVQDRFRDRMLRILDSEDEFERMIGNYSGPGGDGRFVAALVDLFREQYGWEIGPENVALTNGSQTAFFILFNMFGGDYLDGTRKRILLPLAPEYIGYEDVGVSEDLFVARKPEIEFLDGRLFKYHVDFDALEIDADISALCVSRPTNPTGNVLTEEEISKLSHLAKEHDIPFIIDNAYGMPFPAIIYTDAQPVWEPHIILCMSLSKLGLPGARTGIIIADERIAKAIAGMNAIMSLAPGSFGATLALDAVRTGEILELSRTLIKPHYHAKAQQAVAWFREELQGTDFYIHKPEGAFFLWVWFRGLPITSQALYERLKARNVVVVPGQYFFPGIQEAWRHKYECIRVSYAMAPEVVQAGIRIIGEEVKKAYRLKRET